ncbi:MAG: DUF4403 family protein [Microscillaceae bacterium]|jgi:hypothetical protein|nr:DUF4403 family protein [Microscillaceae bacterium]
MKPYFRILLIVWSWWLIAGAVFAQKPAESYPVFSYTPVLSSIQTPIYLGVKVIEDEINKRYPDLLYEMKDYDTKGSGVFSAKVWKLEKIVVSGAENTNRLLSQTTLKIWIKGDYQTEVLGLAVSYPIEQTIAMKIWVSSEISLTKDWQVQTKTKIESYEWLEKPTLDLGLVKIPLTSVADRMIKQQQADYTRQFDDVVKKYLQIRPQIEQAWRTFQTPTAVSEFRKDSTWLTLKPNELVISPLVFQANQVVTYLKVKTLAEAVVGDKPAAVKYQRLPAVKHESLNQNAFEFRILGKISRALAIQKAKEIFMPEVYEYKKYKAKITDLNIYGANDKMVIELAMEGSIDGKIYLTGKPVYDRKSQLMQIIDLSYKLEGTGAFSKFAEWLFRGRIKKQIEKAIEEPVNAQLQAIRQDLEKTLANYNLDKNTVLKGTLNDFYFDKISLTQENIFSEVYLKGNFTLTLLGFE